MAAPELDASRERRLRRAVADLSELAIEDVEAIWSALSHGEQAQLRPLLADAACFAPGNLAVAMTDPTPDGAATVARDGHVPENASCIARFGETLPNELLSRLVFCMSKPTRDAVIAALPPERRAMLGPRTHAYDITERARTALHAAALAASAQLADLAHDDGAASQVRPSRLRQQIRRWTGRRA